MSYIIYVLCALLSATNHTTRGRILGRKSLEFSSLLIAIHSHLYRFALRFLFLQTHATSDIVYITVPLLCTLVGEMRKTCYKTIAPSLWFKKSLKKPQVCNLSRLCPENSIKFYVHEFGFWSLRNVKEERRWVEASSQIHGP
jgi:hypothetical protein